MSRKDSKRTRDLNSSEEEVKNIFERSKRTARSPPPHIRGIENHQTEENMEEMKEMIRQMMQMIKINTEENKTLREEMRKREEKWESEKLILESRIEKLENRLEEQERERKKCNIIIKGIAGKEIHSQQEIQEWLKTKLEVDTEVRRVTNLGKPGNRDMVLVELGNYQKKQDIMKNKSRLRGTEIYIENDLTLEERKIAASIRRLAKEERKKGNQVKIGYKRVYVNKKLYTWDNRSETLKEQDEAIGSQTKN